jgi:predicted nuclease of predicted toxin-antitoxin system
MRTITPALATEIHAKTRVPAIVLLAEDHINHLEQSILTASNSDCWSDMCVANDGSIIRVRVTWGGGGADFVQSFQWQRVSDPTNAAQWQSWTTFSGAAGNIWGNGSCAVSNNNGLLRAFAQQGQGGAALWCWTSTDNGLHWSGQPTTVVVPPGNALIKGIGSAGNNDVFFLYDTVAGEVIGGCFYTTAWSSLVSATLSPLVDGRGLAAVWDSVIGRYTLIYADPYNIYAALYTPELIRWEQLETIAPTTSIALSRTSPRLSLIDGVYHLVYVEGDSGLFTGTIYSYPRVRQSVDLQNWSQGIALHDMPTTFGANFVVCVPPTETRMRYIAATAQKVELGHAFLETDPTRSLDLSEYVLEYQRVEEAGKVATLTVTLDNSTGALNSFVSQYSLTYRPIGLNTTLVLSEGYRTTSYPIHDETIVVGRYHIRRIIIDRVPGESRIQLIAEDCSSLLDLENRYQLNYNNPVVRTLVRHVCTLAGILQIEIPPVAQLESSILTFVLHAGQRYRQALDELCQIGWVEYFLDENEVLQIRELSSDDPIIWQYAPEIETLIVGSDATRANHIIVSGKPPAGPLVPPGSVTNAEIFDDTHIHVTGLERISMYTDVKLFSSQLCNRKADFLLQQEQRHQFSYSIVVPVNPALQLLDVIAVSDQSGVAGSTGLSFNARIYRQEVTYLAEAAVYEQTLVSIPNG